MKQWLNSRFTLGVALALAAAIAVAARQPARETQRQIPESPASAHSEDGNRLDEDTRPGAAGQQVYLDPETGQLRSAPADPGFEPYPKASAPSPGERLNRYGGDLLQEPIPQGGFKVDLRGRFQSAVVATIDPETDTVSIDCVSKPAPVETSDEQ